MMPSQLIARCSLVLWILAARGLAQTTAPSTQTALDQSTPRGALKLFFAADLGSDGDKLRALLTGDNAAQQRMILALADQKNADRDLTSALRAKFPLDWKGDPRQADLKQLPLLYAKIDQSVERIDGDKATLTAPSGGGDPFTLKRVDRQWRIPLEVLFQSVDPDKLEHDAHQIEIQVAVMRAAALDVAAGKYATQSQALEDVKQRMFTAALADHAATQPGN